MFHIVVICSNAERKAFQQAQFATLALGVPVHYFDAYTPDTCTSYIAEYDERLPERDETIACFRSHIGGLAWYVQNSNAPYCLILEDDVVLPKRGFCEAISNIVARWSHHDCIDYVSVGYLPGKDGHPYASKYADGPLRWGPQAQNIWGAQAYLVPREIARSMVGLLNTPTTTSLRERVWKPYKAGLRHSDRYPRIQTDALFPLLYRQATVGPILAIEYAFPSTIEYRSRMDERWGAAIRLGVIDPSAFYSPPC